MSSPSVTLRSRHRPAHVLIDTQAFGHNFDRVRKLAPDASIMIVVKADGYGHGMETTTQSLLAKLTKSDEIGVNSMDDVRRLRAMGVNNKITMLAAQLKLSQLNSLAQDNVRTVFFDHSQLPLLQQINPTANLDLWIKVDSGMGRLGVLPDELASVYQKLSAIEGVRSLSLMSHFANADNPDHVANQQQIDTVLALAEQFEFAQVSLLNSAGIVNFPASTFDMIRPGLMLYGISPTGKKTAAALNLAPVMTFKSELISVKRLPAGSSVGYGSTYTLDADSRIGIVAAGYGDGYPRHAPSGTPVLVNDMLVPLVGRVSMDMLAVELGEVRASVGDEVILWGSGNPIENVAELAGTIAYELSCGILPRVERIVV